MVVGEQGNIRSIAARLMLIFVRVSACGIFSEDKSRMAFNGKVDGDVRATCMCTSSLIIRGGDRLTGHNKTDVSVVKLGGLTQVPLATPNVS